MGAVVQGRDAPARAEVLHESEHTRVTRLLLAGRTVICKEPLGPDARRRVRHESAMLQRLRGVAGVAQLVEASSFPGAVVVHDVGGVGLAGSVKPLAAGELVGLAVGLARAVAGMHRRGVMHCDITPANVVVTDDGVPCLVDFSLASSFAEIRPAFTHHTEIVGTLAYLAPEQTGRTARSVDHRADLYGLGATLYELATGAPPFGFGDPLRLTHDHLACVAVPPVEVNRAVPGVLSEIVMHLLEKEPDSRYQTAEGVVHDLERLRDAGSGPVAGLRVGACDVPLRLLPPSRLVGRDAEVAALAAAFAESVSGGCRGVLVGGVPGVGKTALVDELRSVVTGGDGWFVAGKFDQYRRDLVFDAVHQALRGLGRMLLAEPEDELVRVRGRILGAIGPNAGLLTAVLPEFAALLGVPPDPGDPLTAQVRSQRMTAEVLRAVASPDRPLVVFVDDLQWAGRTPLGLVDLVLSGERVDGLLLVGAYREGDVVATHPLAAPLSRWREHPQVRHLRLVNLPVPDSVAMVAEILRVGPAEAAGLVELIEPCLSGNPYETVELLNALRRDDVLTATAGGWRWDEVAVRARLGRSEVGALLAAGVDAIPPASRRMVEAMACLGGRVEVSLLQAATAEPEGVVERRLAPALDEGLVVMEPGVQDAVRFRHDRIRELAMRGLGPRRRRAMQLAMARRLAGVPALFAVAAEQYLPVVDEVDDAAERAVVVGLLRRAAGEATLIGDYALVNALLTAVLRLVDAGDTATLVEVHTARHAALYSMGRLEDADDEYRTIEGLCTGTLGRAGATVVQVRSLTHRNRFAEAIELGLGSLRELGVAVPAADRLPAEADHRFGYLHRWLDHTGDGAELTQAEITQPALLAAARLINAVLPAAFFAPDPALVAWLSLEALRTWIEHGPAGALLGPASHVAFGTVQMHGDYASGYRALRRIVALGEACGYEPDTSQVRFISALLNFWFEPAEDVVRTGRLAREGLIAGGDLANAAHTYFTTVPVLLDCAATLDACVAEMEAGLAFARQTGDEQTGELLDGYRRLAAVLRGETAPGAQVQPDSYPDSPVSLLHAHAAHAITATVLGDLGDLTRHTAAAMPLLPGGQGVYPVAVTQVLRGLALAGQVRAGHGGERAGLLAELDDVMGWLAARAVDAPANFRHLLRLLDAERAWAVGDFRGAVLAFDAARRDAAQVQRPWHRALITEHAARFHLTHGVEHTGHTLLAEARQEYLEWGATAKVNQLDWAHPTLCRPTGASAGPAGLGGDQPGDHPARRRTVTTGTIDLLGILSASQALSSETSVAGLHARLVEVLSAMTGATGVHLLLWSDDRQDWLLPAPSDGGVVPVSGIGGDRVVPLTVLRYAQRMREPLVVGDATRDDRFARDPYLVGLTCCSLLAVPVLSRGALQAVLLLENRHIRGAFTAERLDGVKLIAGQLAVSLDNAQLYAGFRRIADEQAALRRVATLVARGEAPDLVFAAVADEVSALFGADSTLIARFEPDGDATVMGSYGLQYPRAGWRGSPPPGRALEAVQRTGRATRLDVDEPTFATQPEAAYLGLRSVVASPIEVEGRLWGAMGVGSRCGYLPDGTEQRLVDFTEIVATAVANAESRAELTRSRTRIVAAADQTRRRIERDLHDGAQQRLVALALELRATQAGLPPELDTFRTQLDSAVTAATEAIEELREISRGIHPAILTAGGLRPALRALARRSPVPVHLELHTRRRLPEQVEVSAYYVVAEALTNTVKHAHASTVTVTVEADTTGGLLRIAVHDNGTGGADFARGTGLLGLKDRVAALGGRITLRSPHGAGTDLRVELPLTPANTNGTPG